MHAHKNHFSQSKITMQVAVIALGAITARGAPSPEGATITSGTIWSDDAGAPVHAHGAGLILPDAHPAGEGGKYYLVGTTQKHNPSWLSEGINLYSSFDLEKWHFEGEIFHNSSITTVGCSAR